MRLYNHRHTFSYVKKLIDRHKVMSQTNLGFKDTLCQLSILNIQVGFIVFRCCISSISYVSCIFIQTPSQVRMRTNLATNQQAKGVIEVRDKRSHLYRKWNISRSMNVWWIVFLKHWIQKNSSALATTFWIYERIAGSFSTPMSSLLGWVELRRIVSVRQPIWRNIIAVPSPYQ